MADVEANIKVDIDTSSALASIKNLQRQISAFHAQMLSSGNAANAAISQNMQKNLVNSINATGKFNANLTKIQDTTQSFTNSLEKNKFSMGEYFRYAGASTKTFGKLFKSEFATIDKVARDRVKTLQTQYIKMGRDASGALQAIKVRPLALDMQNLGTQTAMAAQKQQILNQLIKQGSTNLLNWGKNTQWAGRQLMVGFTVPLAMLGTVATKSFMEIEKQAIRFKRVYGEMFTTTEDTAKALKEIRGLADEFTKYGVAVEKTMELAADAAAMGKMGADLTAQVAEATRLAVLGGVEQSEALKTTISLTNAFGVSVEDLARKTDFLNAVENQTVTSIEDLTIAIPKAGPVVQQLGGDVEDLAFFLTAMREGGINASEGANALKSGLASLINPTGKASEMLSGLGINIKQIVEGNAGNVSGIVVDFANALETLDPLNRARAIEQLFGKFQFARISTLFKNVITEGNQASRVLQLSRATAEELAVLSERELKRVEDSPAFKFDKSIKDLQAALAPVGEQFVKLLTPIIEFVTGLLKKFNEMGDGAKSFVTGLVAFLGLIAPAVLMVVGLVANGIANLAKAFNSIRLFYQKLSGSSTDLTSQTQYLTNEQLEAAAVAASLDQSHAKLIQTFTSEYGAIQNLIDVYTKATIAQQAMNAAAAAPRIRTAPPISVIPGSRRAVSPGGEIPPGSYFARGVVSVPGPKGAGDVVPAMLSPGEAVIPSKMAKKYAPLIQGMISGNIPGYATGVFLGMPKTSKSVTKNREAGEEIYQRFLQSPYANTPPTQYGHQISKTSGHSFPIFGLGGVYQKGDKQVFVKPVLDEKAALAEMRSTEISRMAHGLKAPIQQIVVIKDPLDLTGRRRFLALESDLDPTFVNEQPMGVFNEEQYFKQLVASLLRVDKDLSGANVFGDVVADAGPAGVFNRASGLRDYQTNLPSMEEQAMINLLGIKGGAKRAFAESTLGLMAGLTPEQYKQRMIGEIQKVLPALKQTIASFNLTNPLEVGLYDDMIKRLQTGLTVDWSKFHSIHSAVKIAKPKQTTNPLKLADGILSVPGPKGAGDVVAAMLSPGEAVIPAKQAQKYGSLIQGIVADNVPGYAKANMREIYGRPQKRSYKAIPDAEAELNAQLAGSGTRIVDSLASAQVAPGGARKIMSSALAEAKKGVANISNFEQVLQEAINKFKNATTGVVKNATDLVDEVRTIIPYAANNAGATHLAHIGGGANMSAAEALRKEQQGELALTNKQRELMQSNPNASVDLKSAFGMSNFDSLTNQKLNTPQGVSKQEFSAAYDNAGANKWDPSIIAGGADPETIRAEVDALDLAVKQLITTLPEGTRVVDKFEDAVALRAAGVPAKATTELWSEARSGLKSRGISPTAISALDTSATVVAEVRSEDLGLKAPGNAARIKQAQQNQGLNNTALQQAYATELGQKDQREYDKAAASVTTPQSDPFARSLDETKRNSPHDDAFLFGKQDQEAYNQGANSVGNNDPFMDKSSKSIPVPGIPSFDPDPFGAGGAGAFDSPPTETKKNFKEGVGKLFNNLSTEFKDQAITQGKRLGEKALMPFAKLLSKSTGNVLVSQFQKENIEYNPETGVTTNAKTGQVISVEQQKAAQKMVSQSGMGVGGNAPIAQDVLLDNEGNIVVGPDGSPISRKDAEKDAKKAQRRQGYQRVGANLMMAGMVASTAVSTGAMMEGPIGDLSRSLQPAVLGFSALTPILTMLPGPLGLIVAAAAGLYMGFNAIQSHFDGIRQAAMKLADSFGIGETAISKFAEFAGKATASEVMDKKREKAQSLIRIKTGKSTFGSKYMESESGQELINDAKVALSKLGKSQVISQMTNQLVSSVFSGALSPDQARSIAANLGQELGDLNIGMAINGNLVSLLGSGKDILTEPLEIAVKIVELSEKDIETAFGRFEQVSDKYGDSPLDKFFGSPEEIAAYGNLLQDQRDILATPPKEGLDWWKGLGDAAEAAFFPLARVTRDLSGLMGGDNRLNIFQEGMAASQAVNEIETERAEADGAYLAKVSGNMYGLQQALDSVELSYQKQIDAAEKAGDEEKRQLFINKRAEDRVKLMNRYNDVVTRVRDNFKEMSEESQAQSLKNLNERILEGLEGDTKILMEDSLKQLDDRVKAGDITSEQAYIFKMQLDANNFDQTTLDNILALQGKSSKAAFNLMLTMDSRNFKDIMRISGIFLNPDGTPDVAKQTKFIAKFEKLDPNGVEDMLRLWNQIYALGGLLPPSVVDQVADFFETNTTAADEFNRTLKKIKSPKTLDWLTKNKGKGKSFTLEYIEKRVGPDISGIVGANYEYFKSLDPVNQILYLEILSTLEMPAEQMDSVVKNWALAQGKLTLRMIENMSPGDMAEMMKSLTGEWMASLAWQGTEASKALDKLKGDTDTTGGGSGQRPFEDLLKRLKEVRESAVNALGGIKELYKWLGKNKPKNMVDFQGTKTELINLGASPELREFILSKSQKEQQKYFKKSKEGFFQLTKDGQRLQRLFTELSLGDFVVSQQEAAQNSKNQYFAVQKLVKAGMDYKDAWEAVADAEFAAAVLAEKNVDEIKKLVDAFNAAREAAETYRSDLEKLEDVSKKVGEFFSRKKAVLNAEFNIDTAGSQRIIMDAQNEIEALNYKLDDYNAGIQEIEWQEEEVNKKYEERFEALDKIEEINSSITDQARSQLDIADALSKGDISAAAKAAQALREKQAAESINAQRNALESAQEKELAALVSSNGRTRKQLEADILQAQKDIFAIEEKRLEPAQRAIELKQDELDLALFALDQQQSEWEILYNSILDTLDPLESYVQLLQDARDILDGMGDIPDSPGGDADKGKKKKFKGKRPGPDHDGDYPGEIWKGPNATWRWDGKKWNKVADVRDDTGTDKEPRPAITGKEKDGQLSPKREWKFDKSDNKWVRPKNWTKTPASNTPGGATGGNLLMASGGFVSGSGTATSDSIPAMLSNGEYVVKAKAVKTLGKDFFDNLNSGNVSGFAGGGLVGPADRMETASKAKQKALMIERERIARLNKSKGFGPNPLESFVSNMFKLGQAVVKDPKKAINTLVSIPTIAQNIQKAKIQQQQIADTRKKNLAKAQFATPFKLKPLIKKGQIGADQLARILPDPKYNFSGEKAMLSSTGTSQVVDNDYVYNYNVNINVSSNANAADIANTVIKQIKKIDSQKIKGNRI